jgi:predicted nucleic-acid-binding Zn-ribbon protein
MRQRLSCPKCGGNRILFLPRIERQIDEYGEVEAWHLARVRESPAGFPLPGGEPSLAGQVQAYVCRTCGYTEFYTVDADSIPIDGDLVRELVGPDKSGPYR